MYRQALHDAIEERHGDTLELIEGYKDTTGRDLKFPDLVVLANPAFEAELYKRTPADLAEMKAASVHFSQRQLPLLLSISSKGDVATHIIFPVGQTVKVVWLFVTLCGYPWFIGDFLGRGQARRDGSKWRSGNAADFGNRELCT